MSIPVSGTGSYYNIEEYERMVQKFDITFDIKTLNLILLGLSKLPFEQSAPVIQDINKQVKDQQDLEEAEED